MKTKTQSITKTNSADATALFRKLSVATGIGLFAVAATQASTDYGPAIWNPPCNANWNTTGSGHKFHVIHDIEGYYMGCISMFKACSYTAASVHYVTNGKVDNGTDAPAGEITQMVRDANYAWHARCWNTHCTGTEHEGFASNPAWFTDALYQASAGLTKNLGNKFGWAKDRNHIIAHGQKSVSGWSAWAGPNLGIDPNCNTHTDPGPYWDWNKYMGFVGGATSCANYAWVGGAIKGKYDALGACNSFLGSPTTTETACPDGVGRFNHFAGGSIYWTSATGAWSIHGFIRDRWAALGWEAGVCGYPITDENGCPDGVGRFNHFNKNCSIYWTPSTGAHQVGGAIKDRWAQLGWERSSLGYPTSDEYAIAGGRRNDFQHGTITFNSATGAVTVP
jgi:hypothetical protein